MKLLLILILLITGCTSTDVTVEVTPTSNPTIVPATQKPEIKERKVSMIMSGDALIHGAVYKDAFISEGHYDFKDMFTNIKDDIISKDLAYYNQETILGCKGSQPATYPMFNTPIDYGENMVYLGFNLVSLANNHTLDMGEAGVKCSLDFWNHHKDVITAGSYLTKEDRDNVKIFEKNDIKFAFLSYTYGANGIFPPEGKEYLINFIDKELIQKDVASVRDKVDIVMVAMHWGSEYIHEPNEYQKDYATFLEGIGVDLVIGCHPHVIQPIEWINDTLVIYSLGNMISAQETAEKLTGLIVDLEFIKKDDVTTIENVNHKLTYTYFNNRFKDFKLHYYDEMNDTILNGYKEYYVKLDNIVNSLNYKNKD